MEPLVSVGLAARLPRSKNSPRSASTRPLSVSFSDGITGRARNERTANGAGTGEPSLHALNGAGRFVHVGVAGTDDDDVVRVVGVGGGEGAPLQPEAAH